MSDAGTILIVDDEPINLSVLSELLRPYYRVRAANSAERALQTLSSASKPDLILLDIMMPEMDGFELCQQLKANDIYQAIPVMFISAMDSGQDRVKSFEVGGVDFIPKPFHAQEVLVRVRTHFLLHQMQSNLEQQVHKRTQELHSTYVQLAHSEEKFRSLVENLPAGAVHIDPHLKLSLNRKVEELTGYPRSELATLAQWLARLHQDQQASHQFYTRIYQDRIDTVPAIQMTRQDGAQRWIQFTNYYDESGALLLMQDVTAQKQAEQARDDALSQLQAHSQQLESRVAERTQQLESANLTLQKLSKLKDEFLAGVSHELRSPLSAILTSTEVMLEGSYGPLSEKYYKLLNNINNSGRHLLSLINDILDVAKVEAGKMDLDITPVNPNAICQSCINLMKETALKKRVKLSWDMQATAPSIQADARRLKQILLNLLSNAIKFTPEGGQVGLDFCTDADKGQVRFTVRDTGIGISKAMQENLFQPFVQLDSSLSRQYTGTGLGLALVKSFCDMHGGEVLLDSEEGQGSRFTVVLPWQVAHADPDSSQQPSTDSALPATPSSGRILLVDDSADNREVLAEYLELKGFEVLTAHNGQVCLDLIATMPVELILMDVQMPGMDGLETTRRLRTIPAAQAIPVIALTALAMPGDRERCLEAGANEYMSKPVKIRELLSMISQFLDGSVST